MSSTCSVNMENFCLLSGQESPHSSQSHCRLFECACRHLVTKEPDSAHRMGFKSRGVQTAVQAVVHSSHRSLCNSLQQTTPIVCVANGRSPGIRSGCLSGRLESEVPLCLPSSQYCSKSGRQGTSISESRDAPCRTLLENKGTLPSASAPQRETAGTIASDPQTLEATAPSRISQKPQSSQSSCLLAEESLKSQGFSVEVVERVLNPVRKSSQAVYEAKWNCFVSYCQDLDIDHTNISIPQLADFFEFLFNIKKYQPVTIKGYRSALSLRLSCRLGDLGSNSVLNKLFQSFERDRPRSTPRVQPWDLTLILRALTQAPFEPLGSVSLKFLSWKTAFLLALASGRRCSEIHAIRRSKIFHSEGWKSVTFRIDHFLCKNQSYDLSGDFFNSFTIPSLAQTIDSSCKEDRTLCPVRALRYYLDRTKREGRNKSLEALFVPLIETGRELSKASLSNWIKNCISFVLSNCSTENAQVHKIRASDVRAMAASWALIGGFSM